MARTDRTTAAAVSGMVLLAALAPRAHAQGSELEELKAQIEALKAQVEELEKRQQAAQETRAEAAAPVAAAEEPRAEIPEWVNRIAWKGDFRFRHENIDAANAVTDRTRQRIRARFGFVAKVNDSIDAVVQLATTGGNDDPRSTNQTLGDGWDRKGVGINLAYVDWQLTEDASVLLGKMPQPWERVGSYFWDSDLTPEGGAVRFERGPLFATAFGYWLSERSTADDSTLLGGQVGLGGEVGAVKLMGAVGYYDVGAIEGTVAESDGCASSVNPAFFEGAQGNTTILVGGCEILANDFDLIEVLAQAEFNLGPLPLVVFADFIRNTAADDLDTGYSAGFILGDAGKPGTWDFGYIYQSMEKDAQFGQFVDSDFGGGITDTEGSVFRVGYAPAKNWLLSAQYFLNDRFVDVGTESDYDRYQLDLAYKF